MKPILKRTARLAAVLALGIGCTIQTAYAGDLILLNDVKPGTQDGTAVALLDTGTGCRYYGTFASVAHTPASFAEMLAAKVYEATDAKFADIQINLAVQNCGKDNIPIQGQIPLIRSHTYLDASGRTQLGYEAGDKVATGKADK